MQQAWLNPDNYALTLVALFLDLFGTEGVGWLPDTIALELQDELSIRLPAGSFDRLMAGLTILRTDEFYRSLPSFITLCNVLSGDTAGLEFDPADAEEIAWGITEAMLINPPDDDDEEPFDDQIRAYIGAVLDLEGVMEAPDILRLGLRGPLPDLAGDFSDDPGMFAAIYAAEKQKTDAIDKAVRSRLQRLIGQLSELPLRNGRLDDAARQMLTALNSVA